ncbi:PAS domain-containing protein [Antribacter gilvus]|uniref:PAS domain-containing protein n=1 Tax=Antribacter gilvus TaxID=2304675 RepID=UPI0013E00E90|nr:PAS domain-containing protein [Antribacter gilvus]
MGQEGEGLPATPQAGVAGLSAAVQAAQIGTFEWDLVTGELHWDRRALELFGYDDGLFDHTIDSLLRRLHPDDVARVSEAMKRARDTCGEYEAEARACLPDGTTRWIMGRGRAVPGEDGRAVRLVGVAFDATAARDSEVRVQRVLECMPSAFLSLNREWRFTYVNAEAERILSSSREKLLGGDLWELFPATVGSDFERHYRQAMTTGEQVRFEAYYPAPLDRWYEVRAWPSPDGLSVYFLDITAHREAEDRSARATQRADLEARVSTELAETFDVEEAVARLARIVVPTLADWCVVSIVEGDDGSGAVRRLRDIAPWLADEQQERRLRDIGWWHVDERARPIVERYAEIRLAHLKDDSFLRRALASRTAVQIHGPTTTRLIQSVINPGEARDLLARLAPMSAAALPMRARGRTVGALSLFRGSGRDALTAEELALGRVL